MTLIDFLTGFFLMNAMPHLLVGLFEIRFLSAFGYKPMANLGYALLNVVVALLLFHVQHSIQALSTHGILLGALAMLFIYLVTGRYFYNRFHLKA
ncbi:hypothetical protein [Candidatus Leptofilum sp.]|uniref:hypothetical protein n=1 Tax=Candidatus Leptofilum sp. TaxID=3241576 RepID=UPI003B5B7183